MVTLHQGSALCYRTDGELSRLITGTTRGVTGWLVQVSQLWILYGYELPSQMASSISCRHDLLPPCPEVILDNSMCRAIRNFSPLTISFSQEAYAACTRSLAQRLVGRMPLSWLPMKLLFQNMPQPVNSRVTIQIQSWYRLLLQLYLFRRKSFPISRICWECERQRYLRCRCTFLLSNACKITLPHYSRV